MKRSAMAFAAMLLAGTAHQAGAQSADPDLRAAQTVAQMSDEELTVLTHGVMAISFGPAIAIPEEAVPGAGYVPGIARLGIPALRETDASLGVAWAGGARRDRVTMLPSAVAQAASWNPALVERAGAMIGGEAHATGFNVLLAGGINLMRDPRNGRTFEYFSEDPLLSGMLGGAAVRGIQSQNVISTLKHLALNGQETGRHYASANIGDAAARESDLLAFQIAIEQGQPGSIMCAYNRVNGDYACGSDYLMNAVLKQDWGYPGWVMSDWGAVHALDYALHGLDQQSGAQLDPAVFFGDMLGEAAARDDAYAQRLRDMNRRILRSIYAVGVDANPARVRPIDFAANALVAREAAQQGIVLLRNRGDALPLVAGAQSIAVIGGYADSGVLSGGGSSQVLGEGPAVAIPYGGASGAFLTANYQASVPLVAIRSRAGEADVQFRSGRYISEAVRAAREADVAIVFATQWMAEGLDVPDLSLPSGQDALIAAVAAANPNTIVVLETGGAVTMPWLEETAAVLAAWYPGGEGGEAIAGVLFGEVNPSGHLPISFPASVDQLPRPVLDGSGTAEINYPGGDVTGRSLAIDYDIEGSDIGYRWYARHGHEPLFAFGFGLGYTTFAHGNLAIAPNDPFTASFTMRNTGARAGADVAQLYLVAGPEGSKQRLVGFARAELAPGEERHESVAIEPRIVAERIGEEWVIAPGTYEFALGHSATDLGDRVRIRLEERRWRDGEGS